MKPARDRGKDKLVLRPHRFERTPKAEPTVITPYRDGPLLVRGPVKLVDQDGNEILVERETVALCRCGKSRIRPLCDGTHKLLGFKAPSGLEERGRRELSPSSHASNT